MHPACAKWPLSPACPKMCHISGARTAATRPPDSLTESPPIHVHDAGNTAAPQGHQGGTASDPDADLRLALAAAAALCRADRGAGRLCGAVPEGAVAPVRPRLRLQRAADHAGGARPDRRGDDLQPAGDGHRRRLRDLRLPPQSAGPSRRAGMAQPRQRQRAQDQAGDGDHRHLVDPSAAHLHRGRRAGLGKRQLHRNRRDVADHHSHGLHPVGGRHRLCRPAVESRHRRSETRRFALDGRHAVRQEFGFAKPRDLRHFWWRRR